MAKLLRSRTDVVIRCPAADVFRFVAEGFFDHARKWNTQILEVRKTSDGPIRVGTTGVAVGLGQAGQTQSNLDILEYEPFSVFSFRTEALPAAVRTRRGKTPLLTHSVMAFRFEPNGIETTVTISLETDMARYPWSFRTALRAAQPQGLVATAERIKALLETRAENL